MMKLEEFIKKTLVGIARGVEGANKELKRSDDLFKVEPVSWYKDRIDGCISFDVAVTVTTDDRVSGGASIKIWSVGVGVQKDKGATDQVLSRIKFNVAPSYQIF